MKRLLAISSAVFATALFAAVTPSETGFEDYTVGATAATLTEGESNLYFWRGGGDTSVVQAYETAPKPGNTKYLHVETDGDALSRFITGVAGTDVNPTAYDLESGALEFQTRVQFQTSEELPDTNSLNDEKLLISLVAPEVDNPQTNFVITAGKYDNGTFTKVNYVIDNYTVEDPDAWYTLKIVASAADYGVEVKTAHFEIFLGETKLSSEGVTKFPGLISHEGSAATRTTITAVDFEGTGNLDDVRLDNATVDFAYKIELGEGVESVKYSVGGDELVKITEDTVLTAGSGSSITVTNIVYQTGYFGPASIEDPEMVNGETLLIEGQKLNFNVIVGSTTNHYETLVHPVDPLVAKIVLMDDVTMDYGLALIDGDDITFDLNGKTLTIGGDYVIEIAEHSKLKIEDSGNNGTLIGMINNEAEGKLVLAGGRYSEEPSVYSVAPGYKLEQSEVDGYYCVVADGGSGEGGFPGGADGKTFTIDATKQAALEANLDGKVLTDAVDGTTSGLTYAQAYALGLFDETTTEPVEDIKPTIEIVDGNVVVSLDGTNVDDTKYTVTLTVYETASIATPNWTVKATYELGSTAGFAPTTPGSGFYKVGVTIEDAAQE